MNDKQIEINKYTFRGKAVWTDADKQAIIDSNCSTCTIIADADFQLVIIPQADSDIIDECKIEISSGILKTTSRSDILSEIEKRKSKDYNLDKFKMIVNQRDALIEIGKENSLDVSSSTNSLTLEYNKYKLRYMNGVK